MPVPSRDRPLDVLREEAIDRLIVNYGHARLSLEAFQQRLDRAFDAACHDELIALTADLDLEVDDAYVNRKRSAWSAGDEAAAEGGGQDVEHVISVLGGAERNGAWTAAAEIRVLAVLGGVDLDFSAARFTSRTTLVKVLCFCGGVDMYVPEGVDVQVRTVNLLGGTSNTAPGTTDPAAPRLVVEGLVLLGGLDVKVRKTLKERVLEFADGLRNLFGHSPQSG